MVEETSFKGVSTLLRNQKHKGNYIIKRDKYFMKKSVFLNNFIYILENSMVNIYASHTHPTPTPPEAPRNFLLPTSCPFCFYRLAESN